jgi:hypothetical protein
MAHSPRSGRRCNDSPNRRRSRPHLETLEGRCLPSTVTNLNDAGGGSLRDAIAITPAGGTVDFQAGLSGTITLSTGELAINKDLTIAGPGANVITVSGNNASRVFDIAATFTVSISALTVNNGKETYFGGGIENAGTLTMTGCTISDNVAAGGIGVVHGGGIDNLGTLTVTDCTITGNWVSALGNAFGGGIYNAGTLTVTDCTISGNSVGALTAFGGGIDNLGTLTVTDCTISGNSVASTGNAFGGGIYNSGTLTLTGSTITGNVATSVDTTTFGGGIYNSGTLTLTGSTITGNAAAGSYESSFGGGIINYYATLTATDCTISGNYSAGSGGGIVNVGMLTLTNCTVSGNSCLSAGGGLKNDSGTLTVTDSTVSGNSAFGDGGIDNSGTLTINSSTVSGNSATLGYGGGISNNGTLTINSSTVSGNSEYQPDESHGGGIDNGGTLTINSSTITGNSVSGGGDRAGGGIYNSFGTFTLFDTIVAGNTAATGPDLDDTTSGFSSLGHNLIGDGADATGYLPSDLVGTAQNPIDPRLGPLQDNGGPTFTMALLPGSPAINAGDPTGAPMWDQRGPGYPRVVNGMIDIGAYEHQAVVTTITCSVADPLLWPPNHGLVNVGLRVDVQPPDATVQVQVYANDNANASDAADIGPGTLELRAARHGHGSGRVYLIVVTATSGGQTAFDVCTVVVPHDQSPGSIARVQAEAAAAEAYYREFQTAPPGYSLLGQGSTDAGGTGSRSLVASIGYGTLLATVAVVNPLTAPCQSPTGATIPGSDGSGNVVGAGTAVAIDGYFAPRWEAQGGSEPESWVPDLWLSDSLLG